MLGVSRAHPLHAIPQTASLILRNCDASMIFLRGWLAVAQTNHVNKRLLIDGALLTLLTLHHPEFLQDPLIMQRTRQTHAVPLNTEVWNPKGKPPVKLPLPHSFIKLFDARALAAKLPNHAGPNDLAVYVGPFASYKAQYQTLFNYATEFHPELVGKRASTDGIAARPRMIKVGKKTAISAAKDDMLAAAAQPEVGTRAVQVQGAAVLASQQNSDSSAVAVAAAGRSRGPSIVDACHFITCLWLDLATHQWFIHVCVCVCVCVCLYVCVLHCNNTTAGPAKTRSSRQCPVGFPAGWTTETVATACHECGQLNVQRDFGCLYTDTDKYAHFVLHPPFLSICCCCCTGCFCRVIHF
jgi:hypothetical protein